MPPKRIHLLWLLVATIAVTVPVAAYGFYTAAGTDDVVGGAVALGASPVSGSAHYVTDLDDVYRVDLRAGQWLYARMTGAAGTDFDLHLFGPGTRSVSGTEAAVAYSENPETSTERILHKAAVSGAYYVDVWAYNGQGAYSLTWGTPSNQASMTANLPATVKWGAKPVVTVRLTGQDGRAAVGQPVYAYSRTVARPAYAKVASGSTTASGTFTFTAAPSAVTGYSLRFTGSPTYLSAGRETTITPLAYLTTPSGPSSVRPGAAFTSAGYLKPKHRAGGRNVKLTCFRSENGTWVVRKTAYAVNSDYSTYTKYSTRLSLPSAGKWRISATVAADSLHGRTTSSSRYITVTN